MGDIFETTLVGDLVANKGRIISVPDTATVTEVLSTLSANNITAVPVAAFGSHWPGADGADINEGGSQYIGFVSVLDVVLHIADNLGQPEKEMGLLAVNIMGQSNESRSLWTLSPTTKIVQAMEPLSKGIHRFLVPFEGSAEQPGPEINVSAPKMCLLTQTDVVRFFLQNLDYLGPIAAKTVADLGLVEVGQSPVAVPSNMPLVGVLRLMKTEGGLTAIAVVGAMDGITPMSQPRPVRGGKILATISASDFRGLKSDMLRSITDITVEQFLTSISGAGPPKAPVTCRPTTPLATVMANATAYRVHRVWVTNEDGWLSGVVSLADIISAVRQQQRAVVTNS